MATSSLHRTTALTGGVLALLLVVALPVLAGDGDGGRDGDGTLGGAAEPREQGAPGQGKAGGGAGGTGGAGGGTKGGAGGSTAGADGVDSTSTPSAEGGGGGGAHGYVGDTAPTQDTKGGNGGSGNADSGGGGGGGGFGAVISSGKTPITISNSLTGGNGGAAGSGGSGGGGGNGGTGLYLSASGPRSLTIGGGITISGGNGGAKGGFSGVGGKGGAGIHVTENGTDIVDIIVSDGATVKGGAGGPAGYDGEGIKGGNLNIILKGGSAVSSGGDGTRANAIHFLGGAKNRLELQHRFDLIGGVAITGTGASGTLAWGGTEDSEFDVSQIGTKYVGFTSFEKVGSSDWTLTGNNAAQRLITIKDGTLSVDGDIKNTQIVVNSAGTLRGSGTVGSTSVEGGVLRPDQGPTGKGLTVNGSLVFTAASTFSVEFTPTASDNLTVTGSATLASAKFEAVFVASSKYVANKYTILKANDGVVGKFGSDTSTNLPKNFKAALSYDPNNVFLNLTLDYSQPTTSPETPAKPGAPSPDASSKADGKGQANSGAGAASSAPATPNRGLNPNQTSAANALTAYFNSNGGIPMIFGGLTPQGLSQVAGEPVTAVQTNASAAITQFMGALTDGVPGERGISLAAGPAGFASYSSAKSSKTDRPARPVAITPDADLWRWSVWGNGFGGVQFHGADAVAGTAAATNRIYGAAVGADYRLATNTTLGFALGGGATSFNSFGLGSGSSDLFQAGLFLRQQLGASYLSASAAYAWQDVTTDRTLSASDHLQGRFNANSYAGRIEAGHKLNLAGFGITPYAAAQLSLLSLPGYRETALSGPGTFALSFAGKDTTRLRSELGLRVDRELTVAGLHLTLRAGAAWIANSNTKASATATFQTLPGASFLVKGASPDRNALRTSAVAELKLSKALTLATAFEGEFASNSRSLGGKATLRYSW